MINIGEKFICCNNPGTNETEIVFELRRLKGNYYVDYDMERFFANKGDHKISLRRIDWETPMLYPNMGVRMAALKHILDLEDYFVFSFVRNPLVRYVDLYLTKVREFSQVEVVDPNQILTLPKDHIKIELKEENPYGLPSGKHDFNFDFFLKHYARHTLRQDAQLCDKDKNILCDFVGRYETIQEDWGKICKRIDLSYRHLFGMNTFDLEEGFASKFYTPELKEFLFTEYSDEFEVFDYEKR